MIAKRVNKAGKSSFRDLSRYIRDVKRNGEKARDVWATNCADENDLDLAQIEIAATQDLNTRSKIDKTYHLVISLAPGEDLSNEQFREVERSFCEAIGLSDHQRICSIHSDTAAIHMHLAISKIHPLKLTAIEPYYDKYKLQDKCRELEKTFGLTAGISEEKNKSRHQKDAFQKLQSFESYVKEKFVSDLKGSKDKCSNWHEFQAELGRFNLEIRDRGAGLVISHREMNLYVRASAVDRSLSKSNLEGKFGGFEQSKWAGPPEFSYKATPSAKTLSSAKLYETYKIHKANSIEKRSELRSGQQEAFKAKLDEIKDRYAAQRLEIKKDTLIAKGRERLVYQKLSAHMKEEISELFSDSKNEMERVRSQTPVKAWKEWIFDQATQGSEEALGVLRHGLNESYDKGFGEFKGGRNDRRFMGIPSKLLSDGTIEYQMPEGVFIDRGDSIVVKGLNPKLIENANRVAEAKFGTHRTLSGSEAFLVEARKHKIEAPSKIKHKELGNTL